LVLHVLFEVFEGDALPLGSLFQGFHVRQVHLLAHVVEALDDFGVGRDAEVLPLIDQELLVDKVAQYVFLALDELQVGGGGILLLQAVEHLLEEFSDRAVKVQIQRTVEFGALLHDIGKIAVPKAIVNKPGKLDPHEWEIIKTHTVEGQRMLERVGGFMREVGEIVRSSHERWDGGGYPDGLSGETIPLAARIVSCCDAFNAMTTTRPYRNAMPIGDALDEVRAHEGTQFDPRVVVALVAVVGDSSSSKVSVSVE